MRGKKISSTSKSLLSQKRNLVPEIEQIVSTNKTKVLKMRTLYIGKSHRALELAESNGELAICEDLEKIIADIKDPRDPFPRVREFLTQEQSTYRGVKLNLLKDKLAARKKERDGDSSKVREVEEKLAHVEGRQKINTKILNQIMQIEIAHLREDLTRYKNNAPDNPLIGRTIRKESPFDKR